MGVTVAEDVEVKVSAQIIDVFDSAGVLEDVGRNLLCLIKPSSAATGLQLWSKLESASDVTSPSVGTGGSEIGSPTYAAAKFNNGILSDVDSEGCKFPTSDNDINLDKGTIEFWAKMKFAPDDAGYHCLWSFLDTDNGGIYLLFHAGIDDFQVYVESGSSGILTLSTVGMTWNIDDLIHFAVTWDREGNDIGDGKTIVLYVNNVEIVSSTTTWNTDTVHPDLVVGVRETEVSWHSDVIADNLKTYNICKTDFTDKDTESALISGEGVSVSESLTSRLKAFVDVYDSPSLTEDIVLKYPGDRSFSTFDSVGVTEDVTSKLLALVSVFDAAGLQEFLSFTGRLGNVDVYDSVTTVEDIVMTLVNLISKYEEVTIADAASALASIAGISVYEAITIFDKAYLDLWIQRIQETDTWTQRTKEDDAWTQRTKETDTWTQVANKET